MKYVSIVNFEQVNAGFVDNDVVSKCDFEKDDIHLLETSKAYIAKKLISSNN